MVRIVNPRAAAELRLGDVVALRLYDWDDFKGQYMLNEEQKFPPYARTQIFSPVSFYFIFDFLPINIT